MNAFTQRRVTVDGRAEHVQDERRSLFRAPSTQRTPFESLTEVLVYRNTTANTGRSAMMRVMLAADTGQAETAWVFGTSELGIATLGEAERIAERIQALTHAPKTEDLGR